MARTLIGVVCFTVLVGIAAAAEPTLYSDEFRTTRYGHIPDGWRDLIDVRPSRNWIVDGKGFLRPVLKLHTGLIVYDGYTANTKPARALADARLVAEFKTTAEDTVSFGIVGRLVDRNNFYLARFSGTGRLELIKVKDGKEISLDFKQPVSNVPLRPTGLVTRDRYREGTLWKLNFTLEGDHLTAVLVDDHGIEQARLAAIDSDFDKGHPGLRCTAFAAAANFHIEALAPFTANADPARLAKRNAVIAKEFPDYPIVQPAKEPLNTPFEKLAAEYDVVVAGAGTGGWAAAVQAARLGSRVLLLDETDWIGGQMACAAVTSMDEDSVWHKFPVRERGLYREFHESMIAHYATLDKDPLVAYFSYPYQLEGGYEPRFARAMLYGFIQDARNRKAVLDVSTRTRVASVKKQGNTVSGVTVEFADAGGPKRKEVACKVLVDATEYGDVIPLTGARYRVGNTTSDRPDPKSLVQDHTWVCVVREYPEGIPEHLKIKSPPPGYAEFAAKRWRNYTADGFLLWGGAGKGLKGHRSWRVYFAWRGMVDSESPLTGERSGLRHTRCGFNGGNDYPVTAATIEDPAQRLRDEREGIYRTLGALYYFQHDVGVNWALAEDEGYATPYNRAKMKALDLRPDLEAIAIHLPQQPYVRECRRIIGTGTLVAKDLTRFEEAKHMSTSVAMGDYFMDLDHGRTGHAIEPDLDAGEAPKGGGPFQVPFEVFIPETIDGFVPAEKNISQSRLANGATRLQPITMLTGQAAGTIAALSVKRGIQPRALDPREVQQTLLESGSTLIQRWYSDVPWGTPIWRATQMLALHKVLDRPGPIERDNAVTLGERSRWGVKEPLKPEELKAALTRLAELRGIRRVDPKVPAKATLTFADVEAALKSIDPKWQFAGTGIEVGDLRSITAGEFALLASRILTSPTARP